jgi:hypothetical protein
MKIVRNEKRERKRLELIKKHLEKNERAEGVHVSDIVFPRKSYWRGIDPKPMTDDEALFFTAGRAHHEMLEAFFDSKTNKKRADAGEHVWKGIYYSPDIKYPHPDEIKTSRSQYPPGEHANLAKEFKHYLSQLTKYMGAMNDNQGALTVFYISAKNQDTGIGTKPQLRCYDVFLTDAELKKVRKNMLLKKTALIAAKKNKNVALLPLCPAWLCRGCVWLEKCKPWNGTIEMKLKGEKAGLDYQKLQLLVKEKEAA